VREVLEWGVVRGSWKRGSDEVGELTNLQLLV